MRFRSVAALALPLMYAAPANAAKTASSLDMATTVSSGQGQVKQSSEGVQGRVLVFEETHNSRAGRIQIGHMLVRLHKQYGLRTIGLEGAFPADGPLRPKWVGDMPEQGRLRVAARLLREGEVSAAEFMAAAFGDVTVRGVDDPVLYKRDVAGLAGAAGLLYLARLAESSATDEVRSRVNSLVKSNKVAEALDVLISSDPWARKKRAEISQKCPHVVSSEDMVGHLRDIKARARALQISIDAKTASAMEEMISFFQAASERNASLVRGTLALIPRASKVPVALIIGAAHTPGVCNLLRKAKYSFAVITPQALVDCDEKDNLDDKAYARKTEGRSVDAAGLGSLLDGRKNPPPVLHKTWMQSKANTYYALAVLARAAAAGEKAPFAGHKDLETLPGVEIDRSSYRIEAGEVIFKARVTDENGKPQQLWFRVGCQTAGCSGGAVAGRDRKSLDGRIDALLLEAGGTGGDEGPPGGRKGSTVAEDPEDKDKSRRKEKAEKERRAREGAVEIDPGVFAIISRDRSEVERPVMLGSA